MSVGMSRIHVIIGEDDYLVEEAAKRFVGDGVGLETVDSLNATNAELQLRDLRAAEASLLTPPFLEPVKVTWWKNVGFLPQTGKSAPAQDVKAALEAFAVRLTKTELPENQSFVLSGPRLLASSVFAKTVKAGAELVTFASGKPWEREREVTGRVLESAAEFGLEFAPGAAERFVARVGFDTRSLMSELAKLRDYLGDGAKRIEVADVAAVTSQGVGVEPEVWSVTEAMGERDTAKLLEAVAPLEGENGFAVLVTTVVERFFRQLVELKDAEARGLTESAAEGMSPFALRKNRGYLRNWTLNELRVARFRFLELRERIVAGEVSDDYVVTWLVRCCRRRSVR